MSAEDRLIADFLPPAPLPAPQPYQGRPWRLIVNPLEAEALIEVLGELPPGILVSEPIPVGAQNSATADDSTKDREMSDVLPPPEAWNSAVHHSIANPTHILGPYQDPEGVMQMCCEGDGDPYEPSNCGFDTAVGDALAERP